MVQSVAKKAFFPDVCDFFGSSRWDVLLLFFANDSEYLDWPAPCNEGEGQKSGKTQPHFLYKIVGTFCACSNTFVAVSRL